MSGIVGHVVCFILAGFVLVSRGQLTNPTFEGPSSYIVKENEALQLKCKLDADTGFLLKKQLIFAHISAKSGNVSIISIQGDLKTKDERYKLDFIHTPKIEATLDISSVTEEMDGSFECQVKASGGDTVLEKAVTEITVAGPIDKMELELNGKVAAPGKELKFAPGKIEVVCSVYGSNPQPIIYLKFDGSKLVAENTVIQDSKSTLKRRAFVGSAKYTLDFDHTTFGKELECHGETELPEGSTITLPHKKEAVVLQGLVDEPVVHCTNNTAAVGNRRKTLSCVVSKEPKIKRLFFNIGQRYDVYPGNQTDTFIKCTQNDLNTTHTQVILQFHQIEGWHFNENIYLDVLGYDGKSFQFPVFLIKGEKDDTVGTASSMTTLFTLPAACVLAVLLSALLRSS